MILKLFSKLGEQTHVFSSTLIGFEMAKGSDSNFQGGGGKQTNIYISYIQTFTFLLDRVQTKKVLTSKSI